MKKIFVQQFWILLLGFVILLLHLIDAVSFTFLSPHIKNYHHKQIVIKHPKSPNELKLHIKKILNLENHKNSTIDEYISTVFNLHNVNPSYVFRLPDARNNKTIVYRKSDFREAIFPNVTNVNKFNQSFDHLEMSSSNRHTISFHRDDVSEELKFEKYFFESAKQFDDIDYDENQKKIIEENVRTERTFMAFMDGLNKDLEEEDSRENSLNQNWSHKTTKSPKTKKKEVQKENFEASDDWDAFGLSGWSGQMKEVDEFKGAIESPPRLTQYPKIPTPINPKQPKKIKQQTSLINFDETYLKPPIPPQISKPTDYKKQQNMRENISDSPDLAINNISDQLTHLLHDEQVLMNKTGRYIANKPRWPVTSTRDAHNDIDVYLARANNPFGHSTKWKYRTNSSDGEQREGRTKRGAVHLYSMIKCATGCDPISYKGYGCYCGFLGSGKALDGIDRCCKMHDYCYSASSCPMFLEYFVPYLWKCYRGKPLCAIDHGEWGGPNSCASRLCECDQALSKCLRRYYCPRKRPVCTSNPFRLLQNLVMVF